MTRVPKISTAALTWPTLFLLYHPPAHNSLHNTTKRASSIIIDYNNFDISFLINEIATADSPPIKTLSRFYTDQAVIKWSACIMGLPLLPIIREIGNIAKVD